MIRLLFSIADEGLFMDQCDRYRIDCFNSTYTPPEYRIRAYQVSTEEGTLIGTFRRFRRARQAAQDHHINHLLLITG